MALTFKVMEVWALMQWFPVREETLLSKDDFGFAVSYIQRSWNATQNSGSGLLYYRGDDDLTADS